VDQVMVLTSAQWISLYLWIS